MSIYCVNVTYNVSNAITANKQVNYMLNEKTSRCFDIVRTSNMDNSHSKKDLFVDNK